jgi:hypothetical protein
MKIVKVQGGKEKNAGMLGGLTKRTLCTSPYIPTPYVVLCHLPIPCLQPNKKKKKGRKNTERKLFQFTEFIIV